MVILRSFLSVLLLFPLVSMAGSSESQSNVPLGAGMTVTIDPEKQAAGEDNIFVEPGSGPTSANAPMSGGDAEIQQALSEMVSTSDEGLQEQHLENGAVIVDLQGRFQSAMVMKLGENGEKYTHCYSQEPHEHGPDEKVIHPAEQ
ncbi:MAG: hypothetical protein CMF25_04180 [Kangiellaceae bacterium]|nr:hypothetical protein [Kangiellaceae bacterium]